MTDLYQIVETAFNRAVADPTIGRWKSCSIVAGTASVRMAADGHLFMAAALEGVAVESVRQGLAMQTKEQAE